MKLAIYITGHPETSGAASSAYEFCLAALHAGHTMNTIFLIHDALILATTNSQLSRQWQELCQRYGLTVKTCVTAMERRGVEPEHLLDYFVADGLASVTEASLRSDKVMTFH